jgi:hypothetical protein
MGQGLAATNTPLTLIVVAMKPAATSETETKNSEVMA